MRFRDCHREGEVEKYLVRAGLCKSIRGMEGQSDC